MMIKLILTIVFFIILIFAIFGWKQRDNMISLDNSNTTCEPFYLFKNKMHVIIPPNTPYDPQTKFNIGGRYCNNLGLKDISGQNGKYVFPKPKLLYDGIYESKGCISDSNSNSTFAIRNWKMIDNIYPTNGKYTTDNYLPELNLCQKPHTSNIYFDDFCKIGENTRNICG